ncbi:MAG: cupin domain-containing protein [Methylotetracoccus sp.]
MLTTPRIASALLATACAILPAARADEPPMPPRQVLMEKATELPSNRVNARVVRVAFPKGYKSPLHTHEGPGPRYVLKGKVRIEESGQINTYGPGEVFWETGQWMTVENVGEDEAVMIIFELGKLDAGAKPAS